MSVRGLLCRVAGAGNALPIDLQLMLRAYENGIFPMSDARDDPDTFWVEPKTRAILPLGGLHVSRSLAKTVRQDRFEVKADTAFAGVIETCAEDADDRRETWINADIEDAFIRLHKVGIAHSVECWQDGELAGGLYGLAIGRAFCGESMFSRKTDASKVALVWLVARLRLGGFQLLDTQFLTDHLATLGVVELPQQEYLELLRGALANDASTGIDQVSITASSTISGSSSMISGSSSAAGAAAGGADWGALDGFLGSGLAGPSTTGLEGLAEGGVGGGFSSPGKLILHALTQTS